MNTIKSARPWHLWVVGVLAVLWTAGGGYDYTMTQTHNAAYLKAFTPEQLAYFSSVPAWATACWALGVWGAFVGSLFLLAGSRWAVTGFAVGLIGLAGTTIYQATGNLPPSLWTSGAKAFVAVIWLITGLLLYYSVRMRARGVLR